MKEQSCIYLLCSEVLPSILRHRPEGGEGVCLAGPKLKRPTAQVVATEIVGAYLDFYGIAPMWLGRVNLAFHRGTSEQGTLAQGHR